VSAIGSISSVHGNPTPDELVAITVAVTALLEQEQAAAAAAARRVNAPDRLSTWVEASRRAAQRSTLQRGPWRISGRISRRARI
jgi:hypothetical protein